MHGSLAEPGIQEQCPLFGLDKFGLDELWSIVVEGVESGEIPAVGLTTRGRPKIDF